MSVSTPQTPREVRAEHAFLSGGGVLAQLIADFDWSATSLGRISGWPQSLKTTLALILRSHVPIVTLWGQDGVMIYNDAYAVFAAARHPKILGSKVREGWPEVADFNDHVMKVGLSGRTLAYTDQELTLYRNNRPEQVWMNLDYSPVLDEDGEPSGVIAIVTETTEKVLAERWLQGEQERLRLMFAQAPGFMAMLRGPEHVFEFVNPAYQRLVGQRNLLGLSVRDALPEVEGQGFLELLDQAYATGVATGGTAQSFALRLSDEGPIEQRYLDFVYQPVRDSNNAVIGIFVQGSDVTERYVAQSAVEQSAAQFQTFAQAMANQVWTASPDGMLDWFSNRIYMYSGLALSDLQGTGWTRLVHPDDLEVATQRWSRALGTGETYETEFRLRGVDGAYRWHLARALPIRAADGSITRWVGTNTDIHERKSAEAESARDRDRMWAMSQVLMLVCTFDGLITAVNPSATRILGWKDVEMVNHRIVDFVHPDDLEATANELSRLSQGIASLAFESRYRAKSGQYRLLEWTATPDAGRIHAVGRDITQERESAKDQQRIWTLSPVLKIVASPMGQVFAINPGWTRALGWSSEETVGKSLLDFLPTEDRNDAAAYLKGLDTGEGVPERQLTLLTKTGPRRQISWTFVRENETLYGFGRDVTDQRTAEEALRQSQKMEAVGQLTGGIAHDFNNLLQGITGSLDLVQKRISQGRLSEVDRFISGAMTSANRASALTHRLLAFSRRQPLDPRPVRANPLVASMEDLLRRTLGERVELELVLAGGLWLTRCDPNQLESAILNLAINARDAMPDGGKLVIETCNTHLDSRYAAQQHDVKPGQYVCLSVTDTGAGMSAEIVERAFEPFFTTKPIGQGTGLGLSMIYGFAQQSGGNAKIYSEVGNGTTVKLYLPRHRGEAPEEEEQSYLTDAYTAESGETVLVVEDESVVRGLIVATLSDLGYSAIEASDGPKGLEILQSRRRIDLLVTDVGLPGLNGRQIADAGRVLRPGLKVLFMTGYAENAALASGFLEPGMQMITKPFAMEALASKIRDMIGT
jgi:PAS domain S-box-containing protein